ncbi:hypothetical protein OG897_16235 [Streptomyces sp. NBC_00237]|uniref:hypothetical protein n=1 Tax=Streptomyces sp. NBC_00237 TaxID=2975687 RepID=UPI0022526EDE|nr:hypothetical protein [Streptomyces sp. NBC_00237]MCX5202992.1 hypothetical protein [Streptomyces sp. NBC_00237]
MHVSQQAVPAQAVSASRRSLVSQRAALSVAAAAVVGGAIFAPSALAQPSGASTQQSVVAGCGACYPDVI